MADNNRYDVCKLCKSNCKKGRELCCNCNPVAIESKNKYIAQYQKSDNGKARLKIRQAARRAASKQAKELLKKAEKEFTVKYVEPVELEDESEDEDELKDIYGKVKSMNLDAEDTDVDECDNIDSDTEDIDIGC